jgi:hypothetical protein
MQRQLDIFDDSRDVGLRNDLAQAMLAADPVAARRIADMLQGEFGNDRVLAPAGTLIQYLEWRRPLSVPGHLEVAAVLDTHRRLEGPLAAAAVAVLGAQEAPAWLAEQWRWLAEQAAGIGWQPADAEAHPAARCTCAARPGRRRPKRWRASSRGAGSPCRCCG